METHNTISAAEARTVFNYVKRRSKTDPDFRQKLLEAPREILELEFDVSLPADFHIRFVENEGADLTVVLPDPAEPGDTLTDDDLTHVAGGAASEGPAAFEKVSRQRTAHERDTWSAQLTS